MFSKVITSLTPNYQKLNDRFVFVLMFSISFLLRFPFFFRDYIDRDESTFILLGQSLVDGHLPYTQLWDLKPPMVYFFFAGIIYLFGKSFIVIRLIGTAVVALIAFYTYKIGGNVKSKEVGFWTAISCVYLLSLFGSLQGVMSEHLSMLFFLPALYLLIKNKNRRRFIIAGLLFGISLMMKLNLAYAVLGIGIYFFVQGIRVKKVKMAIVNLSLMGLGILLIIALTILPYYLTGQVDIWVNSVVLAPIQYANTLQSSILKVLPLCFILIVFFGISWKKSWLNFQDQKVQLLIVVVVGVVFSFVKSGKINGHYLMQLYPVLLVLIGIIFTRLINFKGKYYPLVVLFAVLIPVESYSEYYNIIRNKINKGVYYNGEGIEVPEYIIVNELNNKNVLFFEYHIGYWVLGANPPTKAATHPSNITRVNLYPYFNNPRVDALRELEYLMDSIKPETVVTRMKKEVFDKEFVEEDKYVRNYLSKYYKLDGTVGRAEIFTRLEGQ